MVKSKKQIQFNQNDVISASEIGQYLFCNVAWFLKKCGYKPESQLLEKGENKHIELGKIIDYSHINTKKSRIISRVGYTLLFIALFIILMDVIIFTP